MLYKKDFVTYLLVLFLSLSILVPSAVFAGNCGFKVTEVLGQGDPALDVNAVQEAVNAFDLVILKGTFDFGNTGSVILTKDVSIFGEMNENDTPATIIKGGTSSFYCDDPDVSIKISQIRFDGAIFCAIRIRQCSTIRITNNEFINLVAGLNYGEKGDAYYDAVGTIIGGNRTEFMNSRSIYCSNVIVSDNYFDMGAYNENGELAMRDVLEAPTTSRAVRLYHCVLERASISNNKIENHNRIGIDCLDAAGSAETEGRIRIKNNDITTGPYAARGGWSGTEVVPSSYGMHCLAGFANPAANNVKFHIKNNEITTYSTNAQSYNVGIYMFPATSNSLVANNNFHLGENATGGIFIAWVTGMGSPIENQPHSNLVRNNKFIGSVTPAIVPFPFDFPGAPEYTMIPGAGILLSATNNNAVLRNNFTELVPVPKVVGTTILPAAHIYLTGEDPTFGITPAVDNVLVGSYGIVVDMTDDLTTPEYDGLNTYKGELTVNAF